MTPQARLVVLIGSRQQVSNAAHAISLLLHPPSSHPPVLQLEAVSIVKSHYPLLNDFSFSSWPPEGTRVSQRIKGLLASADNVRHDLLVEASLVSRIIGPRGNIQKTLQQQTGCVIILPGKAGHQEDARPRDRTILLHENAALEQVRQWCCGLQARMLSSDDCHCCKHTRRSRRKIAASSLLAALVSESLRASANTAG